MWQGALGLIVALSLDGIQDRSVFRATATALAIPVTVRQAGRPVSDLTDKDFLLTDAGVQQSVVAVRGADIPLDITLVVRRTLWTGGIKRQTYAREAADVSALLHSRDKMRIIAVGDDIHVSTFSEGMPTGDPGPYVDACFPLYDGLALGLLHPPSLDRQHVLVVLADSEGSGHITPPEVVRDTARRLDSRIFLFFTERNQITTHPAAVRRPVCPPAFPNWSSSAREHLWRIDRIDGPRAQGAAVSRLERERLSALARESGGDDLGSGRLGDSVAQPVAWALEEARTSYLLYYQPSGVPERGWHPIDVRITRPGRYDVRTRAGYLR